jgi:hypothetical protein
MSAIETFKDILLPFIETHAGISFENLQLFYGQQIREFDITKEMINDWCLEEYTDVQLSDETEDYDILFDTPLNVFDGYALEPITQEYVDKILLKIATLPKPVTIELNKENNDFAPNLEEQPDDFETKIPNITAIYNHIKGKDKVSRVREMLSDFQPMFLERYSNVLLELLKTPDGARIFNTMTELIRALTDPEFDAFVKTTAIENKFEKMIAKTDTTWEGNIGEFKLIIHVLRDRHGTGKGSTISSANVIQGALLYKERRNDFIRSYGAITMIKYCNTTWPNGETSNKNKTTYTFSDLYTGELITQTYAGNFKNVETLYEGGPVAAEHVPYASVLRKYHKPSGNIYTNQEHIVAVYPASCAFNDNCYYETLVQNLQMISASANSDVNHLIYEHPSGKLNYLVDKHRENQEKFAGQIYDKKIELCQDVLSCCPPEEIPMFTSMIDEWMREINMEIGKLDTEIKPLDEELTERKKVTKFSTKTEFTKHQSKNVELQNSIDEKAMKMAQFDNAKLKRKPIENVPDDCTKQKIILDSFLNDKEFKTRKAMLMTRLLNMEKCALTPAQLGIVDERRHVVLSCVRSVTIIIECAKIGVATSTMPKTTQIKLAENTKELDTLRKLSVQLFYSYQQTKDALKIRDEVLRQVIDGLIDALYESDKMISHLNQTLIDFLVLKYDNIIKSILIQKHEVYAQIERELDKYEETHELSREQRIETKIAITLTHVKEISELDIEIDRLKDDMNLVSSNISYLIKNLSDLKLTPQLELIECVYSANQKIVQLLDLLTQTNSHGFEEEKKQHMIRLIQKFTKPESASAILTHVTLSESDKKKIVKEYNLEESVDELSELFDASGNLTPEQYQSSVNVAMIINLLSQDVPDASAVKRKRKGLTRGDKEVSEQAPPLERVVRSSNDSYIRWAKRSQQNRERLEREREDRDQSVITEKMDGIKSFVHLYSCMNPPIEPSVEMLAEITTFVNDSVDLNKGVRDLKTFMDGLNAFLLSHGIDSGPSGPRGASALGGEKLNDTDLFEQMNAAVDSNDFVKMYDLYIEYFDTEQTGELRILFYQVYSILMNLSIYVPLYRCDTKDLYEFVTPMIEKRNVFKGNYHDFDSIYADSFCIQLFGKNVNELLDDLSKGKLTVPRGAFPNISSYPFHPYSLICILEVIRFLCLALPFASRLQFYFAGVLSYMGQSYSDNMNEIQINAILTHLTKPEFFQSFHKASALSKPLAPVAEAPADAPVGDAQPDAPDVEADVQQDSPDVEQAFEGLESDQHENTRLKMKEYGDLSRLGPFEPDDTSLAAPAAAGGTRRKRQYKQKTKRYRTLSKRFKKNKTRRLHRSYIRN